MDWLGKMNGAIRYIEEHLTDEIDTAEAAKIACCSVYHFQRMFSFITDVSLSEYIRRRRLTLAAFELQTTDRKVLDLALKYGYDSPEAFTRAFQNLHGVTPTAARRPGVLVKAYPRMTFTMSIQGDVAMKYRIEEVGSFSVIGEKNRINMHEAFEVIPPLWEKANQNGLMQTLIDLLWSQPPTTPHGILGVCANGNFGNNEAFDYYIGAISDGEPLAGMESLQFPESAWAVFEASSPAEVQDIWKRVYTEWVPTSGYDLANLPSLECYCPPGHQPVAEVWVAIEKNNR
ncbi:AraC family transcriptional regulator [Tumebacillus flagellatus]|uniref:AraC family transcriptional regulator n=1 Tax=Tumebacillus flagellatus TaxID=1157490 RepID=A0A074LIZ8_9BACL|nr:AraC family transcriptional regulator [Tumebacillus flagellatus]KEO82131.1 AraC family transcriptional regulator [Tumebacillus flagellatus]